MELFYVNKKGNYVKVNISLHSVLRFKERYEALYQKTLPSDMEFLNNFIKDLFSKTNRIEKLSRKEKKRLLRYGEDTLFFRNHNFTFVIQNATIVTIEISAVDKRYLNKTRED
jgi:hypothetical protein